MEKNKADAKGRAEVIRQKRYPVTLSKDARLLPEIKADIDDLAVRTHALVNAIERVNSIGCATGAKGIIFKIAQYNLCSAMYRIIDFYHSHGRTDKTFLEDDTAGVILLFGEESVSLKEIFLSGIKFLQDTLRFNKLKCEDIPKQLFETVALTPYSEKQKKMFRLFDVVRADQIERVKTILADNTLDLEETDEFGNPIIITSVLHENQEVIGELLKKKPALINKKLPSGTIPLLVAHQATTQQFLLKHGADLNYRDAQGDSPLITAVKYGSGPEVSGLVQAGADVHFKDAKGRVALHWAFECGPHISATQNVQFNIHNPMIMPQNMYVRYAVLKALLIASSPITEPDNDGVTPFMLAVERGHIDLVGNWVDGKMITQDDLNRPDKRGRVPKSIAFESIKQHCDHNKQRCNHFAVLERLNQAGAHANGLANKKPPLFTAIDEGDVDLVINLILCKADFKSPFKGKTAIENAKEKFKATKNEKYKHIIQRFNDGEILLAILSIQEADLTKRLLEKEQREKEKLEKEAKEKKMREEAERQRIEAAEKKRKDDAERERVALELRAKVKEDKRKAKKAARPGRKEQRKQDEEDQLREIAENRKKSEQLLLDKKYASQKAQKEKEALALAEKKRKEEFSMILQHVAAQETSSLAAEFVDEIMGKAVEFQSLEIGAAEAKQLRQKKDAIHAFKLLASRNKKKRAMAKKADAFKTVLAQSQAVMKLSDHAKRKQENKRLIVLADQFRSKAQQRKAYAAWEIAFYQRQAIMAKQCMEYHRRYTLSDNYLNPALQAQMQQMDENNTHLQWLGEHLTQQMHDFTGHYLWNKDTFKHSKIVPQGACAACNSLNVLDKAALMQSVNGLHWSDYQTSADFNQTVAALNQKAFLQLRANVTLASVESSSKKSAVVALVPAQNKPLNAQAKEFRVAALGAQSPPGY